MKVLDLGFPPVFLVRGEDAERYLSGQVTQDVRKISGTDRALPGCICDARGKVLFRVWLAEHPAGGILVIGGNAGAEELHARLEKYLIADDAEIIPLQGARLLHWPAKTPTSAEFLQGAIVKNTNRFGGEGTDVLLISAADAVPCGDFLPAVEAEDFRIGRGIPAENEIAAGMFPQELGLEETDVSYHKGCYVGQEVISRIKRAGKVNHRLARFSVSETVATGEIVSRDGKTIGKITSVSPVVADGKRAALGFLKRGAETEFPVGEIRLA